MAVVRPFKAIRPVQELVSKVAALPYDVMNSEEARELVKDNPYSFLHVDKAEIDLPREVDIYDFQVYEKAKENLQRMISEKVYIQDKNPNLYIYKLTMNNRAQVGLVGCTSVDEYEQGIIKKHELTREDKEIDRIRHVDICNANTGPIFLTYQSRAEIQKVIDEWMNKHVPLYDFTADDGITHTIWIIDAEDTHVFLTKQFAEVEALYIADGHHRSASAAKVGLKRKADAQNYTGEEEFNYFLSVIFPNDQLYIMDYNRVIKDLNGYTEEEFIQKLQDQFEIEISDSMDPYKPTQKHTFGLYMNKKWYILKAKDSIIDLQDPVARLDVSILQEYILSPFLDIQDPRSDKRIDFVGGIRGLGELVKRVDDGGMKVAFSMYPTTIQELMDIADAGKIMPPKSTWFEPKLRSGIFIHQLDA